MKLVARNRTILFPRDPLLMGIVNVNDDSFCGDGTLDPELALQQAETMVRQGADIIDVGGESARTNRGPVSEAEEIRRVVPFVEAFEARMRAVHPRDDKQLFPPLLSINTWRPSVAREILQAGGDLLNDIGGLPNDANATICAETGAALLIMHSVGQPKVPHTHVGYSSILETLDRYFEEKIDVATWVGVHPDSIVLDPGIDFAKQRVDNLKIINFGDRLARFGRPVLWPISRKTVIGEVLCLPSASERDAGTLSCLSAAVKRGGSIFRVHNVEAAYAATRVITLAS